MHRFYVPPEECTGARLKLPEREAHHAFRVLRLQRGDPAVVLDGAGTTYQCKVVESARGCVEVEVCQKETAPSPGSNVALYQALPKGKTFETIIQKATELRASRVVPVLTERVVAHLDDEDAGHKMEKWQLFAVEAIKQSGSPWLPKVTGPVKLAELLKQPRAEELSLIGSLHGGTKHIAQCFAAFRATHQRHPRSVALWVGPEGDFTSGEVESILAAGAQPVSLGPVVLRADTAATYLLSVVNHELTRPA